MSSHTHDEFLYSMSSKKIAKFANKARLSFRHNDLWSIMKSITVVNKIIMALLVAVISNDTTKSVPFQMANKNR